MIPGLGCTPPPAAYFSLRSYVAFKFDPEFWFPAAELGDPANHLVLNSTGSPEDPFSKTAMMLSTGDEETVSVGRVVGEKEGKGRRYGCGLWLQKRRR